MRLSALRVSRRPLPQLREKRRGFSLVEMAVVLGIVSVIIGGVWTVAVTVREKARVADAVNEMNIIAQNMSSLLQGGYGVSGIAAGTDITAALITNQTIPTWAVGSATRASHPWNPTGLAFTWVASNPRTYRASFTTVSRAGCLGLITGITSCTAGQPGCPTLVTTAAGGSTLDLTANTLGSTQLQTLCDANNYAGGTNSVEFDFRN